MRDAIHFLDHWKKIAIIAMLAVVCMAATSASAKADDANYGAVYLRNDTDRTVYYAVRWGTGNWRWDRIPPGSGVWEYTIYRYPNENRSPKLSIRFNCDLTGNNPYWHVYTLRPYAVVNRKSKNAHVYAFRKDNSRQIELYDPDRRQQK